MAREPTGPPPGDTVGTDPPDEAPAHTGTTFDDPPDRFAMAEELGRGGMGRVVAATDRALGRAVAIKQVFGGRDEIHARFEREVRITAQLEHPSIVPIHDAGRDPAGRPYYVMRRIAGEPLSTRLAAAKSLAARLALVPNVLAAVEAAAFAHARRIIHRDIKPSNIMLGEFGETHLIDWGIARRLDEAERDADPDRAEPALTQAGSVYGTVAYMAPEQARGEPVDERADVFALGATLFHVLAGAPPFEKLSAAERIAQARSGTERVAIERIDPEVPHELVAIVAKATAGDREVRYRDARALAADLRAFLNGQLVAAHRYTVAELVRRFVRRHRIAVTASAVALAAAIVLGALAIAKIMRARDDADAARDDALVYAQGLADREAAAQLQRAEAMLATDATHAALLAAAIGTEHRSQRARDLLAGASIRGIANGVDTPGDRPGVGAMSPDGEQLATGGTTALAIYDLRSGRRRAFPVPARVGELAWPVPGAVVMIANDALVAVDVGSGAQRRLAEGPMRGLCAGPQGAVRYVDLARHALIEVSVATGASTVLAEGVDHAASDGDVSIVAGERGLRLLGRGAERMLQAGSGEPSAIAASARRGRVAASFGFGPSTLREWDLDGVLVRTTEKVSIAYHMAYSKHELLATAYEGVFSLDTRVRRVDDVEVGTTDRAYVTEIRNGAAYALVHGGVAVADGFGFHKIAFPDSGLTGLVGAAHSPYLAVLLEKGVRWWNLDHLVPQMFHLDDPRFEAQQLCWVDAEHVVTAGPGSMAVIERATGVARTITSSYLVPPLACLGQLSQKTIYLTNAHGAASVELGTGRLTTLPVTGRVLDERTDAMLSVDGDRLLAVPRGTKAPVERWRAPGPIERVAVQDGWLAAAGADWLYRLDGDHAVEVAHVRPDAFGVDARGAVWWSIGRQLWWWDGAPRPPRDLGAPVQYGAALRDAGALVLDDGAVWLATADELRPMRLPIQRDHYVFGPDRRAVRVSRSHWIAVDHLDTDTEILTNLPVPLSVPVIEISTAGDVFTQVEHTIVGWHDPVPSDAKGAQTWLRAATRATIDVGTDVVTWPIAR